jgi:anthraniloyl-CoA monooxygenase
MKGTSVVCLGGGPGGLFTSILLKLADPSCDVRVIERSAPDSTWGFGVVFSDETLGNIAHADPESIAAIEAEMRYWSEMDTVFRGRKITSGGHGFAALSRLRLLQILGARARDLGVEIPYETEIEDPVKYLEADLVVGSDGLNSLVRSTWPDRFGLTMPISDTRFIWLGTKRPFDRFNFLFEETLHGIVQAHVYPYDEEMCTFIVEMDGDTWRNAGLDSTADQTFVPGASDMQAVAACERIFAQHLDGHALIPNASVWRAFPGVSNTDWYFDNVVLIGDAVHTAHYSIGSGTKLALEDAVALAGAVADAPDVASALHAYETERRPPADSLQRTALTSQRWFENVGLRWTLPDHQFNFSMMTRSLRVTYDNLAMRDSSYMADVLADWWEHQPDSIRPENPLTPPMFYPYELGEMRLANRIVVSRMAQYCATDGMPDDWHFVHLGGRAVGGAGLVMTEMTCVSPGARITPGCTGLWSSEQAQAWTDIVTFVHDRTPAKIGLQLGHAGRKGSTKVAWEGTDQPLEDGNWPLISASPIPYLEHSQAPEQMTLEQMDQGVADFVHSTELGAAAGFDMLEIHAAHGYLLASFLSPFTNRRTDGHGGSLENRLRFPLRVIEAVRSAWPAGRPLSVRISATDWIDGGLRAEEAVQIARAMHNHGADLIDVSTGQTDPSSDPEYGRLYQTPFAERIRLETGIPTMTVGGVASVDDVNTILVAGRADLCALARPHLIDPYWTLNAAIDQDFSGHPWPDQYLTGHTARRREQDPTAQVSREEPAQ